MYAVLWEHSSPVNIISITASLALTTNRKKKTGSLYPISHAPAPKSRQKAMELFFSQTEFKGHRKILFLAADNAAVSLSGK